MTFHTKKLIGAFVLGFVGFLVYNHGLQAIGIFLICGASNMMFIEPTAQGKPE